MNRYSWILLAFLALDRPAGAIEIPLPVEESAGSTRRRAPVTSGLCLPRGEFGAGQRFRLLDGAREVPLQTTPLVVERDGSLRRVLLDFQLDTRGGESRRLTLRTEPGSARHATPLRIFNGAETLAVNTGPVRFTIRKTGPFRLFEELRVRGRPVARAAP